MGKKDFIMNNKPAGRITPDNSIVIDKITSLMTQGKAEKALDEIKKLDIDESNPDYYFIRGITGFALLSMGAQADYEDKALEYTKEANKCFREAYENGMDFPDIEDAIAFTDNLIDGDFDAIDEMFSDEDDDDNPVRNLAQEMMFTMPLLRDLDAKEGKEFTAIIRAEEDYDISLDDFRGYLSDVRHMKIRKKKCSESLKFTLAGIDCEIAKLPAETAANVEKIRKFIKEKPYHSEFDADEIFSCSTVLKVSLATGKDKRDAAMRGVYFTSLLDSIFDVIPADTVEVFGFLYDGIELTETFANTPTHMLIMKVLPVPTLKKVKKGFSFVTEGFASYGLPELEGIAEISNEDDAYSAAESLVLEVMKYSVFNGYGPMPERKYALISGREFHFKGMKGDKLEVRIL